MMNERGSALPLALLSLSIIFSLTIALGALSTSEPSIAGNHLLATQARTAADAGLQAVAAAYSNPIAVDLGFASTIAAAPFVEMSGSNTGFRVAVVEPAWAGVSVYEKANQLVVTAVGYAKPAALDVAADVAPGRAIKMLSAVIQRDSLLNTFLAPAAITLPLGGALRADVDARLQTAWSPHGAAAPNWCLRGAAGSPLPPRAGAGSDSSHGITQNGGRVWGPGNDTANEPGADVLDQSSFPAPPAFLYRNQQWRPGELAALKALAITTGTFYSGASVAFGSTGLPLPPEHTVLYVEGNIEIELTNTTWNGWVVAVPATPGNPATGGRVQFICSSACPESVEMAVNGLVYAEDTLTVAANGNGRRLTINGAVVTRQISGAPTTLDASNPSDLVLNFRCQGDTHLGGSLRGVRDAIVGTSETVGPFGLGGASSTASFGWKIKPGSYRELPNQP